MSSLPVPELPAVKSPQSAMARGEHSESSSNAKPRAQQTRDPITVLIVVPTLDVGAADVGAVGLVRILTAAGHRAIVASQAGRLVADVTAAGGEFVALDVASNNPFQMLRSAVALNRIAREQDEWARLTNGRLEIEPNSGATIPGRVVFNCDLRHPDAATLGALDGQMQATMRGIAKRSGLVIEIERVIDKPPVQFAGELVGPDERDELQRRHRDFVVALAEASAADLHTAGEGAASAYVLALIVSLLAIVYVSFVYRRATA